MVFGCRTIDRYGDNPGSLHLKEARGLFYAFKSKPVLAADLMEPVTGVWIGILVDVENGETCVRADRPCGSVRVMIHAYHVGDIKACRPEA